MKLLVLVIASITATSATATAQQAAAPDSTAQSAAATEIIEIPRHTLTFKPSRDDMTVAKVVFSFYCAKPDEVRLNGVKPDPAWGDVRLTDKGVEVDRRNTVPQKEVWAYFDLPQVAKNQFDLRALKIELPKSESRGLLCMSVKVWFKEVSNKYDSMFYEKLDDRYALVSFTTGSLDASNVAARFKQNRVGTVQEFKDALSKPFEIKLKNTALREEWTK